MAGSFRRSVTAAVVAAVIGAAACSPAPPRDESTASAPVTTGGWPPTTAAEPAGPTRPTSPTGLTDPNAVEESGCRRARDAFAVLAPGLVALAAPTATPQQRARFAAEAEAFRGLVPDDVKGAADVYLDALSAYVAKLAEVGPVDGSSSGGEIDKLAEAATILESPDLARATDRLETYFREVCGAG